MFPGPRLRSPGGGRAAAGSASPRPRQLRVGGSATGAPREATKVRERLTDVQERFRRARANLRILEEQVAYLGEVADEADTRRLVAETPLADREWRAAKSDHERHNRAREETLAEIEELDRERDRLLDRLLELERTP
ncbi:MAG: hypothetical protein ACRDUY_16005 [Nitriliruptorales bacterium]